jgi:hypothetical protein
MTRLVVLLNTRNTPLWYHAAIASLAPYIRGEKKSGDLTSNSPLREGLR